MKWYTLGLIHRQRESRTHLSLYVIVVVCERHQYGGKPLHIAVATGPFVLPGTLDYTPLGQLGCC